MSQLNKRKRICLPLPAVDWMTHRTGELIFFTQSPDSKANPFQKHAQTHPEMTFYQLSGHLLAQSS